MLVGWAEAQSWNSRARYLLHKLARDIQPAVVGL